MCKEGTAILLLGKNVEGVSDKVMEELGECIMFWVGKWRQRRNFWVRS